MFLGVEDGIFSGYADAADVCFIIATLAFFVVFVVRLLAVPRLLDQVLVAAAFTALALGWLVL